MFRKFNILILIVVQILFSPIGGVSLVWAQMPTPPEVPTIPVVSDIPIIPDAPTVPDIPTALDAPDIPSEPVNEAPEVPSVPDVPSMLDQPEIPVVEVVADSDVSGVGTDVVAENNNTGANSINESFVKSDDSIEVVQNNDAEINNDVVIITDTGGNSADKNTGDGVVKSGDATVQGTIKNEGNSLSQNNVCEGCSDYEQSIASNSVTGANSNNDSEVKVNSDTMVTSSNTANLDTGVIAIADSGHNSADKNTGNGSVESGDVNVGLTMVNVANTNISGVRTSEFDVYDDHNGDIVIGFGPVSAEQNSEQDLDSQKAENSKTGADSGNVASNDNNTSLVIVNDNDATVLNDVVVDAISGGNSADKNTGNGSVESGDVNVVNNVVNLVNNTIDSGTEILVATVNIFGDLVGDIILSPLAELTGCSTDCDGGDQAVVNSQTGANSNNEGSVSQSSSTEMVQNNEVNIDNSVVVNANTGNNDVDKNTGNASVETGEVNVRAEQVTVANNNIVGGDETWWIVIVNEAGNWIGKIFGADGDGNVAAKGEVNLGVVNQDTGASSDNQAEVADSTSVSITQNNTANVDNNVVINADTGNNSAKKNTGDAVIRTGDVNVYSNVINYVNNNIVGGRVVITFVNVFGSWIGDVITPGYEKSVEEDVLTLFGDDTLEIGGPILAYEVAEENDSGINMNEEQDVLNGEEIASGSFDESEGGEVLGVTVNTPVLLQKNTDVDKELSPRVLAGTWLVEEDDFLQATPTPTKKAQAMAITDSRWFRDMDKKLLGWLLLLAPVGSVAWFLKKRFLVNLLTS